MTCLVAGCGGDPVAPGVDARVEVDAMVAPTDVEVTIAEGTFAVVAVRDGGAPWRSVPADADGRFRATVTSATFEVMGVCTDAEDRYVARDQALRGSGEGAVTLRGCTTTAPETHPRTVTGIVSGAAASARVDIDNGIATAHTNGTGGAYTIAADAGPGTALFTELTDNSGSGIALWRYARAPYDTTSGSATVDVDLAAASRSSVSTPLHVTNVDPAATLETRWYLYPASGGSVFGPTTSSTAAAASYEALPAEARVAGDEVRVVVNTAEEVGPYRSSRTVATIDTAFVDPIALPDPIAFGPPAVEAGAAIWVIPETERTLAAGETLTVSLYDFDLFADISVSAGYLAVADVIAFDSPSYLPSWPEAATVPDFAFWEVGRMREIGDVITFASNY